MCGVPASGKTTWALDFCERYNISYVSRDEIRFSLVKENEDYFSKEKTVFAKFADTIATSLKSGCDIIADATHINKASRRKLINSLKINKNEYDIIIVYFNIPLATVIERNSKRTGRAFVPPDAISNMLLSFQKPHLNEFSNIVQIMEVK
jgi:predicted kinase